MATSTVLDVRLEISLNNTSRKRWKIVSFVSAEFTPMLFCNSSVKLKVLNKTSESLILSFTFTPVNFPENGSTNR